MIINTMKDESGKLIHYTWPGGYQVFYIDNNKGLLCPECAQKSLDDPDELPDLKPIAGDVYYEGPTIYCDQCNRAIESAYGDPNEADNF